MRLRSTAERIADPALARAPGGAQNDRLAGGGPAFALLAADDDRIDPLVVAAFGTDAAYVAQIRAIRAKVQASVKAGATSTHMLAVVGIDAGAETAVLSANLAVVYAQLGTPTALVDCGLTEPAVAALLRVAERPGMSEALRTPAVPIPVQRTALAQLVAIPAGQVDTAAQSLLHRQSLIEVMERWALPSIEQIVVSLPDMGGSASSLGNMVAGFDGAVLVANKGHTRVEDMRKVIDALDERGVTVFGSVIH